MLNTKHTATLRDESGISEDVIEARGYRTITNVADLKECGFTRTQWRTPGLLLPLHDATGNSSLFVYRPDNPRVREGKKRQKDGTFPNKVLKYELPKGCKMKLDCPPICQPQLSDPSITLWVTEGQKKADCLASRGLCALALLGVWNWRGKNDADGLTVLADWEEVALNGRQVNIVFDSDVLRKYEVQQALERFKRWLQVKKATVGVAYLPLTGDDKTGVDDWLVSGHTVIELQTLVEAPRPEIKVAAARTELLDDAPLRITRPLSLVGGRAYVAAWPYYRKYIPETIDDKTGKITKHNPPKIEEGQQLILVRDDGIIFGDGGDKSWLNLELDIHLPEVIPNDRAWSTPGLKAYREGSRPDPIDVFERIVSVVDRFMDFDDSLADQKTMCELSACYAISTWFLDAFNVIGYQWPNGVSGSGKTNYLHTMAQVSYLGQVILAGGSYASLRDLADYGATLAFDDAENLDNRQTDQDKRALLLAGNRRGSTVSVKEMTAKKTWRTRYVNTFCPRMFSAINLPDNVLANRSVIIPLVPTLDRHRANVDPLDFDLWPCDRRKLIDDLWAMALAHLPELQEHNKAIASKASLIGRNLDTWRGVLAIADWLPIDGLWDKMDALSVAYQKERPGLERGSMVSLVLKGLCATTITTITTGTTSTIENKVFFDTKIKKVREVIVDIVSEGDPNAETGWITSRKIGKVLSQLRFKQEPRPSGGSRIYRIPLDKLRGSLIACGLPVPDELEQFCKKESEKRRASACTGSNGFTGCNGCEVVSNNAPDTAVQFTSAEPTPISEAGANGSVISIGDWVECLNSKGEPLREGRVRGFGFNNVTLYLMGSPDSWPVAKTRTKEKE